MRHKHRFRPGVEGQLEDRIALSQVSALVQRPLSMPSAPLRATFTGRYVAIPPAGLGGASSANLTGSARVPGLGQARVAGSISSNPSLAPPDSNTQGYFTIISRQAGGNVVAVVSGSPSDLASRTRTTVALNYQVVSAPPRLANMLGTEGTALLTLNPRGRGRNAAGPVSGQFNMRVVQS